MKLSKLLMISKTYMYIVIGISMTMIMYAVIKLTKYLPTSTNNYLWIVISSLIVAFIFYAWYEIDESK